MTKIIIICLLLAVSACTDAIRSSLYSYGEEASIVCYSGGDVIFKTQSTGKVESLSGGGWAFREKGTDNYITTFADCFVRVEIKGETK